MFPQFEESFLVGAAPIFRTFYVPVSPVHPRTIFGGIPPEI